MKLLNETAFRKIFQVPEFEELTKPIVKAKSKQRKSTPRPDTLIKMLHAIHATGFARKQDIVNATGSTGVTVRQCVNILLATGEIDRVKKGYYGDDITYYYYLKY